MASYGYLLPTRGVVLSSRDDQALASKVQSEVIGLAKRAESHGFDAVWVGDSVLAKPRLEPLSTLAAVGAVTDSVDLGTAVYLPTLRHAVHVAHLAATADQISGGRLALGVGIGIGSDVRAEYDNLDRSYATRAPHLDELLDVITQLWGGEPIAYDGTTYELSEASIGFGPVNDIPIYVASAAFDPTDGFPDSILQRIARYGDGWLPIMLPPATYTDALDEITSTLADAGRDAALFDPAYYFDAVIHSDPQTALEEARQFFDRYYPAQDTLTDEQIQSHGAFGPPSVVKQTLEEYEAAGVDSFVIRFPARDQRQQLRRFARLV